MALSKKTAVFCVILLTAFLILRTIGFLSMTKITKSFAPITKLSLNSEPSNEIDPNIAVEGLFSKHNNDTVNSNDQTQADKAPKVVSSSRNKNTLLEQEKKIPTKKAVLKAKDSLGASTSSLSQAKLKNFVSQPSSSLSSLSKPTTPHLPRESSISQSRAPNPYSTRMTFDPNLIVQCKDTPHVICNPGRLYDKDHSLNFTRIFKIASIKGTPMVVNSFARFHKCVYTNCVGVGNNSEVADVVVVSAVKLKDEFKPPPRRKDQLFVMVGWEPPALTYADFQKDPNSVWNNQFNLTMTYRIDSDIFLPYAKYLFDPKPLHKRPNYYEIAKSKTKTAVWFVSNCKPPSRRDEYVKEMQKYIDVDIYGKCGYQCQGLCPLNFSVPYKFYLSFENAFCTDYVTEKVFNLNVPGMYIIPVVRGGFDYDKYLPEHTFINTEHFPNAKALALHLKSLGSDLERYSQILEYRDLYGKTSGGLGSTMRCELCKYLNTLKVEPKIYDAKKWLSDGHCQNRPDIF